MIIPIDRKYNEQNMQEVLPILAGLEHFVFYGSLLGLIREGDLLEKDDDIDLLINMKHFDEVLERFEKHRGALEIKQEGNNLEECRYFRQATCIREGVNTYVDLYFYDDEIKPGHIVDRWNIHGAWTDPNMHILIPKNIIYPIGKKSFEKYKDLSIPSEPVACLQFLYGQGWMHPRKKHREYVQHIKNNRPYYLNVK